MGEQVSDPAGKVGRVDSFDGDHRYLSNYSHHRACYDGVGYRTAEHAFAAAKTLDLQERAAIAALAAPGDAKRYGQTVTLRPGWDRTVRYEAMREIVSSKFSDPDLAARLEGTGDALLVEGNTWHDQTWGGCTCPKHAPWPGRNMLGRTLMDVRSRGRSEPADRWVRVACTGHRERHLEPAQRAWMRSELARVAVKLIAEHGMRVAIHGGANGADLAWAEAAAESGVEDLWAYLPCLDQTRGWTADQIDVWCRHTRLRSEGGEATFRWRLGDSYSVRLLHARNDAMLRDCQAVVAVHDPAKTTGGTASAVAKAVKAGLPVIRLDPTSRTVRLERN